MSEEQENEVSSASAGDVLGALARTAGTAVGTILTLALGLVLAVGTGLAIGRAADLLQGAVPRPLDDWTGTLDGWALLFAAYVLVWLPLASVARRDHASASQ